MVNYKSLEKMKNDQSTRFKYYSLNKLFLQDMVKKNNGKILNISSVAASTGPLMSLYYATKAYILHFTEAIADEVKIKIFVYQPYVQDKQTLISKKCFIKK